MHRRFNHRRWWKQMHLKNGADGTDRSGGADGGTYASPTAVGAVRASGSRQAELRELSKAVEQKVAQIPPSAVAAGCVGGSRLAYLTALSRAMALTLAQTLQPPPLVKAGAPDRRS